MYGWVGIPKIHTVGNSEHRSLGIKDNCPRAQLTIKKETIYVDDAAGSRTNTFFVCTMNTELDLLNRFIVLFRN